MNRARSWLYTQFMKPWMEDIVYKITASFTFKYSLQKYFLSDISKKFHLIKSSRKKKAGKESRLNAKLETTCLKKYLKGHNTKFIQTHHRFSKPLIKSLQNVPIVKCSPFIIIILICRKWNNFLQQFPVLKVLTL